MRRRPHLSMWLTMPAFRAIRPRPLTILTLLIQSTLTRAMTWEQRNGVVQQVPDYDRHLFADLSPSLMLEAEESLVIGLSNRANNEYLVGSRFLTRAEAGKHYETLLCLTPQPYPAQGRGRHLGGIED